MAEYRYYLIPDAMTRAFPEQFGKQTPTEFFDNIADLKKRYLQLREMPYNNERTWNERARFPYERLVVGVDRQNHLSGSGILPAGLAAFGACVCFRRQCAFYKILPSTGSVWPGCDCTGVSSLFLHELWRLRERLPQRR